MHYLCQECQNSFPAEQLFTIYKQIAGETKVLKVCSDCRDKHEEELEMTRQNLQAQFGEKDTPKHPVCLERDSVTVDIHKIIDDAMEKKDRTINVYIGQYGTSIYIHPYAENKTVWKAAPGAKHPYCSSCGKQAESAYPYCPWCGESVAISDEDAKNISEREAQKQSAKLRNPIVLNGYRKEEE